MTGDRRAWRRAAGWLTYEGMAAAGIVRSVLVRGEFVVRGGRFVGRRGYGRFQERRLTRR